MLDPYAPTTKVWFDTEFCEDGRTVDLLSIGMVRTDGQEYYAVSSECDVDRADDWTKKNVLPKIDWKLARPRKEIRKEILCFLDGYTPEFWAYFAGYDWLALCQLFGKMVNLPSGWPMYCCDIRQLADALGNPRLPGRPVKDEHHALQDARWVRKAWEFLVDRQRQLHDHSVDLTREILNRRASFMGYGERITTLARELSLALPPRP